MLRLANKIKKIIEKTISLKEIYITKLTKKDFVIYLNFGSENYNAKNKRLFKLNVLPLIKTISNNSNTYLLYKKTKYTNGDDLIKIYIKDKTKKEAVIPKTIFHLSPKKNRKKILKYGLIPQSFEKSNYKGELNYYYEPAIFCTKNKYDAKFLFCFEKSNVDIWEVNLSRDNKKWFFDYNMEEDKFGDCFFMTHEKIKPENLKLVDTF